MSTKGATPYQPRAIALGLSSILRQSGVLPQRGLDANGFPEVVMLLMKTILSCLFALLFTLTPASAVIIVLAPTDTTEGSLEITQPIHFPITQSGDANVFVF